MSFLNNTVSRWFADTSMGAFEIQVKTRGSFSSAGDVSCAFKQRFRFCSSPFNISRLLFPCLKTIPNKFLISLALSDHFRANSSGFISAQVLHDLRRMAFRSFTPSQSLFQPQLFLTNNLSSFTSINDRTVVAKQANACSGFKKKRQLHLCLIKKKIK